MCVFCDVDVREDSSDLAFFVNNECHPLRVPGGNLRNWLEHRQEIRRF
jgi:hypothetical protein